MPEAKIVQETAAPRTVESLRRDLALLGVRPGEVLMAHTSLSSIGWVCGGAQALVEVLLAAVGPEGTLVMPAHTVGNTEPAHWRRPPVPPAWHTMIRRNMPAFEVDKTPTWRLGATAELFRTWPGTLRSNHPVGSTCANGPLAERITSRQLLTPMWGMDSPLGALYELDARVLLIGVGYSRCTCLHLAEVQAPGMPRMACGAAMLEDGRRVWKTYEDFDYGSYPYGPIGQRYEDGGHAIVGKIGNAKAHLCRVRPLVEYALEEMRKHPLKEQK
jgi:aminoglycoside 3-N-acetyltransferase